MPANVVQTTFVALWPLSLTDVAAVKDKPMMGFWNDFFGYVLAKSPFGGEGRATVGGQSDAFTDTKHVGVDRHRGFAEIYSQNHVCSLAANAGQRNKAVEVGWDFAAKFFGDDFSHFDKMRRFAV